MTVLPEPTPTAPAAGQAPNLLSDSVISAAVDNVIEKAKQQGTSPQALIGTSPPVEQPGRPPMSQSAVDASTMMLSGSVLTAVIGGSVTAVLWASGSADPVVVGFICAAPAALAVPVLAVGRILRRAKEATPDVHHHHYTGHVDQRTVNTKTSGLWAKTNNQQ